MPYRFALPYDVKITPDRDGLWEDAGDGTLVWRLRIESLDAYSLNLGFARYRMPAGGRLLLHTRDAGQLRGPFTAADVAAHGELWTPVLLAPEAVIEVTVPAARRAELELALTRIGQGYRGFGSSFESVLSGACNMDIECIAAADPWRANARAVGDYTVSGSWTCTGSLLNNTAQDRKLYFMTANHCGVNSGNAASVVAYWNYRNSTCRVPGSPASGGAGDGSLAQFYSGAIFRSASSASDFTLIEFTPGGGPDPAFGHHWAGWNRSSSESPCSEAALCAGVHHPNNDEMRITFSDQPTITSSWGGTPPPTPGDGSHIWVHWDDDPPYFPSPPGVTEPGSSGSPFYDQNRRFIGQLHGGASACGATGDDLSDIYGRLSVSWTGGGTNATRVSNWLDPGNTGATTLDGVDLCTPPDPPANPAAAPNGDNRIDVSWDTVAGAETYRVFRSFGACPGTSWALLADDLTSTSYSDLAVLGGSTYAYQMTAVDADQPCESVLSACVDATATGSCPVPDPSTLTSPANGATNVPVRPAFAWTASPLAFDYLLEVDDTANFSSPVYTATVATTSHTPNTDLPSNTHLYWRVTANNPCGATVSTTFSFTTVALPGDCATGTVPDILYDYGFESGVGGWTHSGTGDTWALSTAAPHGGTTHFHANDPVTVSNQGLISPDVVLPTGENPIVLKFWHTPDLEPTSPGCYDGGILEVSTNGGSTWSQVLNASLLVGPYTGVVSNCCSNPLAGLQAWCGTSSYMNTIADISAYAGQTARFRLRLGSDSSVSHPGWNVDDVVVQSCQADTMPFLDGFETGDTSRWSIAVP